MNRFDGSEWIFVGDVARCPHSSEQIKACKALSIDIKGAVLCNNPDHAETAACKQVPAFPSFCSLKTNICVAGLRRTHEEFDALQRQSDATSK